MGRRGELERSEQMSALGAVPADQNDAPHQRRQQHDDDRDAAESPRPPLGLGATLQRTGPARVQCELTRLPVLQWSESRARLERQ